MKELILFWVWSITKLLLYWFLLHCCARGCMPLDGVPEQQAFWRFFKTVCFVLFFGARQFLFSSVNSFQGLFRLESTKRKKEKRKGKAYELLKRALFRSTETVRVVKKESKHDQHFLCCAMLNQQRKGSNSVRFRTPHVGLKGGRHRDEWTSYDYSYLKICPPPPLKTKKLAIVGQLIIHIWNPTPVMNNWFLFVSLLNV